VKSQRIIGLGLCVIDHIYRVEHLDLAESRLRFVDRREAAGGMTATALRQASSLGCRTEMLSLVGDDADGRRVRRALRESGVGIRHLVLSRDAPTTVAVCLVEKRSGERRFLVADRRRLERGAPDFDLSAIRAGTLLLVDGHFAAQALRAVRRAKEVGARVIADFSRPTPAAKRLLPFVDHPIVPEEFARHLFDGNAPRTLAWLAERCRGAPIVTQGALGGVYLDGRRVRRYRARRTRVVDTTGAGDVFHGAFAWALLAGWGAVAALQAACAAAALNCRRPGAQGGIPDRSELTAFLLGAGIGVPEA
jgi:sugar/nucleoside kinase (ribokinase family)